MGIMNEHVIHFVSMCYILMKLHGMGVFYVGEILVLIVLLAPVFVCSSLPTNLTLQRLYDEISSLIEQHPEASLREIGRSVESRPIYVVKIENGTSQNASVIVEFGIHGRELASVASSLFVIKTLLKSACKGLLEHIKWYVIPVLNPDGYQYAVEKAELWRKNRARISSSDCVGVDLNRNFPVGWENRTGEQYYCKSSYCGETPLSEPESLALKRFLDELKNGTEAASLAAYISVHTCAPGLFYPYGYKSEKAENYVQLEHVGYLMQSSIKQVAGSFYQVAPAYELGVSGGAVDEWVYDTYEIPLVYTFELDHDFVSFECFFASPRAINRLTHECFAGLEALGEYLSPNALSIKERGECYTYDSAGWWSSSELIMLLVNVLRFLIE